MAHFGDRLRQERERQGVSLEEIARSTKVAPHLLEALEANRLGDLPGGPFNKGFVRSYAIALGLDPEDLIAAYTREEKAQGLTRTPDADRELMQEMARLVELRSEGGRRTLVLDWSVVQKILAGAMALGVVLLGLWLWLGRGESSPARPVRTASDTPETLRSVGPPDASRAGSGPAPREPGLAPAPTVSTPPAGSSPAAPPEPAPREPDQARQESEPAPRSSGSAPQEPGPAPQESRPAPAPEQAPATAPPGAPSSRIRIEEAGTGTGVRGRILVGRTDTFRKGDRVWFWNRAMDGRDGEIIRHVWLRNGEVMGSNEIRVGGPHWRNWSWKTMGKNSVGDWAVEVRDSDGRVLERVEFTCLPAGE